jgi:subtilisin-like proprotein convertase family protein
MKKYWLFALLIFAAVIAVVFFPKPTRPSADTAAARSTGVPPVMEPVQRQAGRLPSNSATPPASIHAPANPSISEATRLAPFLSAPIALQDGGSKRVFELATDQLYLRGQDGASRILAIPATDSPEAFSAAIEQARAENGTEPELILYPVGFPRNEFTRRIVTREVVISAPSQAEADILAAQQGLVFQKAPVFAPNAFIYEAPTSLAALGVLSKQDAQVEAAPLLASRASKKTMPNDPFVQLQWHLKYQGQQGAVAGTDINVESVWNYPSTSAENSTRGREVVIGIVDDGMEWSHPDLAPNVLKDLQYDWNGKDNDPMPNPYAYPPEAHGTACAGVAAARGNNRIGVSGVAPEANLVGMRLIAGDKTDLDEAEAMTWKMGDIHILSNSWGPVDTGSLLEAPGDLTSDALKYAADFGRDGRGTIITWAGGNGLENEDNSNYDGYANSIYTIAIGAVNSLGIQSDYSESGSNLVVSAPSNTSDGTGLGIMTTDNKGRFGYNPGFDPDDFPSSGDVTKTFGGTSSACPTVSGVIALMLEKNPDLGWRDVQEILIRSAKKVDENDPDWIDNGAGFHFNHKYGAGLVNAAATVELADGWINLGPQESLAIPTNNVTEIPEGTPVTRSFTVSSDELRVEHVTLRLTVENTKKGDLTITLTSPDGTESVFCEPHSDQDNSFTNWTFMTVRNWGEMSNGTWTLSITNNGVATGSLTEADLVVFGTDPAATGNPPPVVTLQASRPSVFVGSILTLNATAIETHVSDAIAPIELEAFVDGVSLGTSANGTWTLQANAVGIHTFTVNATGQGGESTTRGVEVEVLPLPIAAWDFDTSASSAVPLGTVIQSTKKYLANFGSGNLTFRGEFTTSNSSNLWSHQNGEIWVGNGTPINAVAAMVAHPLTNKSLLLRGGKNLGAEGKALVFEFSMADLSTLNVSYSATGDPSGAPGFAAHVWEYSSDRETWNDLQTLVVPTGGYARVELDEFSDLANEEQAFLRVRFTGATAASGQNLIDNIIFSAAPASPPSVVESFTVLERSAAKSYAMEDSAAKAPADLAESSAGSHPVGDQDLSGPADSTEPEGLDWVVIQPAIPEMLIHAEVVEGAKFLTAPGSLLSANEEGQILGLAEPVPQTTRYELGITSTDSNPKPLRLKVYDAASQKILVLDEKVPFVSGKTIGSPSAPKRYKVAYQEVEQMVEVAPGWNSFTTAVDPDPATLAGALADYDHSEGDRLIGPAGEALVVDGKWTPAGFELEPEATYSLWRQAPTASQILLKGKEVRGSAREPVNSPLAASSHYGIWIDLPPGSVTTADWVDTDGDGIDDRRQPGPGQPVPQQKKKEKPPVFASPSGSHGGASHAQGAPANARSSSDKSFKKSSKKSKSSQKSKDSKSDDKHSGKKKKNLR